MQVKFIAKLFMREFRKTEFHLHVSYIIRGSNNMYTLYSVELYLRLYSFCPNKSAINK